MAETLMADGMTAYTPGVNCMHCGRFVGRDGYLAYEYFEMSSTLASLEGECRRCLDRHAELVPQVEKVLRTWDHRERWLTKLNIANVIENSGGERYSEDEIFRALWSGQIHPHVESSLWTTTYGRVPVYRWKREDDDRALHGERRS